MGCAFVHFLMRYCTEDSGRVSLLEAQNKNSGDAAATAKKHHRVMVKTKVKIIERVKQGL